MRVARPDPMGLKYTRSVNREVEGITYYHHRVTGSDLGELADTLGWKHGDELVAEIRNGKLVVGKKP